MVELNITLKLTTWPATSLLTGASSWQLGTFYTAKMI